MKVPGTSCAVTVCAVVMILVLCEVPGGCTLDDYETGCQGNMCGEPMCSTGETFDYSKPPTEMHGYSPQDALDVAMGSWSIPLPANSSGDEPKRVKMTISEPTPGEESVTYQLPVGLKGEELSWDFVDEYCHGTSVPAAIETSLDGQKMAGPQTMNLHVALCSEEHCDSASTAMNVVRADIGFECHDGIVRDYCDELEQLVEGRLLKYAMVRIHVTGKVDVVYSYDNDDPVAPG